MKMTIEDWINNVLSKASAEQINLLNDQVLQMHHHQVKAIYKYPLSRDKDILLLFTTVKDNDHRRRLWFSLNATQKL